ncbi:MAG TPA: sulfatase-like hydrolase/transferase [Allosphingosinicella sp.]|nr:sulfatase-like hydrolase/transferase [Allosphingosinicella sp.]
MKIPLKELLIILYLAAGYGGIGDRIGSLGLAPALLLYLGLFGLLSACLVLAAYVRNAPLRWVWALLLSASALFLDSSERILGDHLSYDAFINLTNSRGFAGDALGQHARPIAWSAATALLLFAGVALKPRRAPPVPRFALAAAPLAAVGLLSAILFARGGEGARGLPGAFTPLSYASLSAFESAGWPAERQAVAIPRSGKRIERDIVLIVDESVGGNYLDLNAPGGARSGLKEPRAGAAIRNYGYAAAITNCSIGTNLTLRYGGTRADYRRINATMPSIWSYARAAGLRTVYIDAQRIGGQLHNLMTEEELHAVDRHIQFDAVPVRDRDMAAADALAELLGNRTAEFVMVNKVGAHFPIHDKYPDAFMRYRPALPRGGHEAISDTGSRAGFGGSAEDWRRYRNSYRNTLLWNVGGFFDRLLARADLGTATLIYTSDHGQDLHERGRTGLNTHCSSDPVPEEGLVPLVVIEGDALETLAWERHLDRNRNRVSHYQIFPTLLELMGYAPDRVRPVYGDSLVARSRDAFTFNTLFNARLGRQPVWKRIELAEIVTPEPAVRLAGAASDGAARPAPRR